MDARRLALSGVVVVVGAGLGLAWMSLPRSAPDSAPAFPPGAPEAVAPTGSGDAPPGRTVPLSPAPDAVPSPATEAAPEADEPASLDPAVQAFRSHADEAVPLFRQSARILRHAEPPVYGDIADQLADRLSALGPGASVGERQELVNEERQLIEHLRRRYEGLAELESLLDDLDHSLQDLQDSITEVGPSPDPRSRSARGAELPHGQ